MKVFFKMFIASLLGVFTAISFMGLCLMGLIFAVSEFSPSVSLSTDGSTVKEGVLHLRLGTVVGNLEKDPFEMFLSNNFNQGPQILELSQLLKVLKNISKDSTIKGVLLEMNQGRFNWATANEIRQGLLEVKGKPIVAFTKNLTEKNLFVLSAATKIYMMPYGSVEWNGFSSSSPYLKKTLEKWNINAQVVRAGKFKSAAEMFVEDQMSEANRQQTRALLGQFWSYIREQVAKGRKLTSGYLDLLANKMSVTHPKDALKAKLIDGLLYMDQVKELKVDGVDFSQKISLRQYLKRTSKKMVNLEAKVKSDHVAVIYATGEIVDGYSSNSGQIGSEGFLDMIEQVKKSKKVKALVIRVNSPGGSALASEEMYRSLLVLKETNKSFPIVVSFGGAAASGGYYMAAGADQIFADPLTVTGSIGVFALLFDGSQFLTKDLQVNFQNVKTHENANFIDGTKPMSEFERRVLQRSVNEIYDRFIAVVAQGRNKNKSQINKIAQGRVWSGLNAQKIGLVDQLGGLEKAIKYAATKAHLKDDYHVHVINDSLSKWKKIAMGFGVRLQSLLNPLLIFQKAPKGQVSTLMDFLTFFSRENGQVYMLETRTLFW